jgi:iron complex transport system ATP-binding protein
MKTGEHNEELFLEAKGLRFSYRGREVLAGVDLAVRPGEVVALLGANGAGKSTLLKLLLGLLKPMAGTVSLGGKPLAAWSRKALARELAYVPQVHVTPFPYTVLQVAGLGRLAHRGLLGQWGASDRELVFATLDKLGIAHLANRAYTEISGGERQLTLIARALVQGARLLVMDEPVSGLDYGHQMRLLARLQVLAEEGYGILKTTHYPEHALGSAHRVVVLQEGAVLAKGLAAEIVTPAMMHRLYGLEVEMVRTTSGHGFFHPVVQRV